MAPIILRRLRQEYLSSGKQGYLARHNGGTVNFQEETIKEN